MPFASVLLADEGAVEPDEVIDATGLFVLPGGIDSHVHLDSDRAGVEGLELREMEHTTTGVSRRDAVDTW